MKRLGFLAAFLLLFLAAAPTDATAQTPNWQHQIYFNSGPQFVTGDAADGYKTGLAIDGGYYYRASDAFFIGLAGGYHQFVGKGGNPDLDIIPVHLAFKYNFSLTGVQPYIGVEGGPYFVDGAESSTEYGFAPRLGLRIPLSPGFDLDLNVKYNVITQEENNFNYIGLNGGPAYIPNRAAR
jgi:opacity protein-like surface antigen